MSSPRQRFWKRWICAFDAELREMRDARAPGMIFVGGNTPGFCAWGVLLLCGTSAQMRATEQIWTENGWQWCNRIPRGAFDISTRKTVSEVRQEARQEVEAP